jgi:hypothetical protein
MGRPPKPQQSSSNNNNNNNNTPPPAKRSNSIQSSSSSGSSDGGGGGAGAATSTSGMVTGNIPSSLSYTPPPQWLLGEKSQQTKFFTVPIPPVLPSVRRALTRFLTATNSNYSSSSPHGGGHLQKTKAQRTAIKLAQQVQQHQQDYQTQRQRVKNLKEKLVSAQQSKQVSLDKLRRLRQEEMQEQEGVVMHQLEDTLRAQHDKKLAEQEMEMKQKVQAEFEKEFDASSKKRKLQQDEQQQEELLLLAAKKQKLNDDESNSNNKEEPITHNKTLLKSELQQESLDELKTKLENLQETKTEMVWLLKQVIKAETKRKIELVKLQKKKVAES